MKAKAVVMLLLIGMMTMGFDCVNDDSLFSVNISGITGTYNVNPGNNTAYSGSVLVTADNYLDIGFDKVVLDKVRIYDILVSTVGTYGGNVSGTVQVNGVQILAYNGSWAAFNTPQSLVTSPLITRNAAGLTALVTAIRNKQNITLAAGGTVSQAPVPSGLAVKIEVLGQVDAEL